ncbi:hypothetical protein MKX03_031751 [Papaver bracteatum]|nr:hypothetical protein MKX03_031751 [Papaver bracteatum]
MVRLMHAFTLAASIMAGISLSGAFDVFTCSVKFQLPGVCVPFVTLLSFTTHHWMVWLY